MEKVKRNPEFSLDDLESNFDYESEAERKRDAKRRRDDLSVKFDGRERRPGRNERREAFEDEHGRLHSRIQRYMKMDAYSRHKEIINLYYLNHQGSTAKLKEMEEHAQRGSKTDYDVLRANHRFLWDSALDSKLKTNWELRLAKKYYDKLYKEYCVCDLSLYKQNRVAMRWLTETEVREGKGQIVCCARKCINTEQLISWEVNFAYMEQGERKNALVKLRLCPSCSVKLNHHSQAWRFLEENNEFVQKSKYVKKKKTERKTSQKQSDDKASERSESKAAAGEVPVDTKPSTSKSATEVWSAPVEAELPRALDQDIDDFLDDIFN